MTVEIVDLTPEPIEIIDVTPQLVEAQDVVTGPPGPQGPSAGVSDEQLEHIIDEIEDSINDGPDLILLYLNAKA